MALAFENITLTSKTAQLACCIVVALAVVLSWAYLPKGAHAATGAWATIQTPKATWENSSLSETIRPSSCTETKLSVMLYNELRFVTGCGRQIGPINLVKYEAYINYNTHNMRAIQFPGDSRFYNVNMSYGTDYRPVPNSEKMIEFNSSAEILIHNNVPQHLTKVTYGTNGQNEYVYAPDIVHSVKRSDGSYMDIGQRRAISPNGKWLVVYDSGTGLVRVNLDTYETRLLDNSMGLNGNALLDVSNNGEIALYSGSGYVSAFIFDGKDCGTSNIASAQIPNPCPYFDAGTYIRSLNLGLGNAWQVDIDLSDDGHEFRFKSCTTTQPFDCKIYTLTNLTESATYTQADQLEYLALGDSYSSGEGDTARNPADNSKYYRFGTDVNGDASNNIPREKCHISTRSYPYILSKAWRLAIRAMTMLQNGNLLLVLAHKW